jgi:hypothetical protein
MDPLHLRMMKEPKRTQWVNETLLDIEFIAPLFERKFGDLQFAPTSTRCLQFATPWRITRVWGPGQFVDDCGSASFRQTERQVSGAE